MEKDEQKSPLYAMPAGQVAKRLESDTRLGLTEDEARRRLAQFGPNSLKVEKHEPFWEEFLEELREPMILLLLFTGVLYSVWGELSDAITIFFVILTLNTVEVVNEQRAKKAIQALRKLAEPSAAVLRRAASNDLTVRAREIPVEQIVPGDLVLLQAGRRIPADARLVESYGLALDESTLTGESLPVEKEPQDDHLEDTPLAERDNMVYAGTLVVRGRGSALVTATGMASELGRVAGLASEVKEPSTPLQTAMRELSGWLVWLALGFSLIVPLLGVFVAHQPLKTMLLTGLSLAFATIPEEMPIIITMVLALGAYRLSRQHAIARRLKVVETLGAVTVIATDKTGTLTENRLQVAWLSPEDQRQVILKAGVLGNGAAGAGGENAPGDPLDRALLDAARQDGLDLPALLDRCPLVSEFTFDNQRKRMSTVRRAPGNSLLVTAKGAPESILAISSSFRMNGSVQPLDEAGRAALLAEAGSQAARGVRLIALAEKEVPDGRITQSTAESNLVFVGMVGLLDPPRPEAREVIASVRRAGIRPLMVTGDHPLTARSIAEQVGLDGGRVLTGPEIDTLSAAELQQAVQEVSIYARTTPEHKLRIVNALHAGGERVAVTGDGVNDAPALAAADIGVAMGESGSDVAREAAGLILADDNFSTIANAVREGRILYENLRKGVRYYLAVKVALVSVTLLPVLLAVPVPFAPVQIILMELFMDLAAAAAFVAEPPEAGLMDRPPRDPGARFMDRAMLTGIFSGAAGLFAAVSLVYLLTYSSGASLIQAQTSAFVAWMVGHVLLAFNLRSERQPLFQLGASNRLMLWWGAAALVFVLLASGIPGLRVLFKTAPLTLENWALILAATLAGTFWLEIKKLLTYHR